MSKKIKVDHSKSGLGSPDVEGQGTTTQETGSFKMDSARKKNRKKAGGL
ncbi:YuzL family protein [Bacillus sp. Marseille-P3661]|nr:YuzL family protein [Bacillus sp. Marseille-P3661]